MPDEPTQARRFGRARTARSTTVLEDYVELIDDLLSAYGEARATEVARRLGVSHPTAIKKIARLKLEGLVTARPYRGLFLTDTGHELAERIRARHRLMVDVLVAVGVPRETAESDAEGMEHYASAQTLKAFARFLADQPATTTNGTTKR
jgi:DtxR family transcriptional regulator, manganese transport regulator